MILTTARLRLEPWGESHTALLVRLSSLPAVMRHVGPGAPWPREMAEEVALRQREHRRDHGFGWRAIVEAAGGDAVGFIALNFAGEGTARLDPSEYEIGWWLDPSVWSRGLALEAAAAVRDEALGRLAAPSVVARIQPANEPSLRLAGRLGMSLDFETTGRSGERLGVHRVTAAAARATPPPYGAARGPADRRAASPS